MNNKSVYWAWAIHNSLCVIGWIVLAIVFNKWWIALFSILFISEVKNNPSTNSIEGYYRICDKCGKHSPITKTKEEAATVAKAFGWTINKVGDEWDDRCPDCQDK